MADNVVMPWRDHGITSAIMTNGARAEGASAKEQEEASSSLPSAEESDREDEDDDLQSFLEEVRDARVNLVAHACTRHTPPV